MLETGLIRCVERERENGQSGASLLHACVTDFAGRPESVSQLQEIAVDRLSIAGVSSEQFLLLFVVRYPSVMFQNEAHLLLESAWDSSAFFYEHSAPQPSSITCLCLCLPPPPSPSSFPPTIVSPDGTVPG